MFDIITVNYFFIKYIFWQKSYLKRTVMFIIIIFRIIVIIISSNTSNRTNDSN